MLTDHTPCTGCGAPLEDGDAHEIDTGEDLETYCDMCAAGLCLLAMQQLGLMPSGREAAL